MLRIKIVCVGKPSKFYIEPIAEYTKRLSRFAKLEIIELPDEKAPEGLSASQRAAVMSQEAARILPRLQGHIIALDIAGQPRDTLYLSSLLEKLPQTCSTLTFVIGGSLGLAPEVLEAANERLSFSPMTFCHSLARVMLLEQLYRAFKISINQPYHK